MPWPFAWRCICICLLAGIVSLLRPDSEGRSVQQQGGGCMHPLLHALLACVGTALDTAGEKP